MKIACISTSRVPSDTANSIQAMKACHALAQLGHETALWLPETGVPSNWEGLAAHYGLETPFTIRRLASLAALKRYDFARSAVRQARAWGAELVYTWLLPAAVLAQWRRLPVVFELHDRPTGKAGPALFRRLAGGPGKKRILAITEALRSRVERELGVPLPPSIAQIAPNGADLVRYRDLPEPAQARRELGLPERVTGGYTGHFYAGRGIEILVGLARRYPLAQFLWVGGRAEDVEHWRAALKDIGVENVTLTGFVENRRLPLYQAAADILLMPYERAIAGSSGGDSAEICSPMKMFDYLAAGRAIITSDLPVLREVLNEGNAVFCSPEDLPAWERAFGKLLDDADWREESVGPGAKPDAQQYAWQERARKALEGF